MNSFQEWLRFFENVSSFYRVDMCFSWGKYPNYDTDIWDSLAIFLEVYAFERKGRKPDYFHATVDALFDYKQKHNGDMNKSIFKDIWKSFKESLNNQKLNEQNNPLCPKGTNYKRKYKGKSKKCTTSKLSIMEVVLGNIVPLGLSFTNYFREKISDNIQNAHNLLKSIQGIGDKIASFYLRDLAVVMKIKLNDTKNRYLLQPIDIWIERTVRILTNNQRINRNKVAKWIVENSNQPELVNMGIWYFCSQIAVSEYKLKIALGDLNIAKSLLDEHINRIQNICEITKACTKKHHIRN